MAQWQVALTNSANLPDTDLPPTKVLAIGPPPARSWPDKDPAAASRLAVAKEGLTRLSQEQSIPIENLVTPDLVRRVLWSPPFEPGQLDPHEQQQVVEEALREGGARAWQINLVADAIVCALNHVPDLSLSES